MKSGLVLLTILLWAGYVHAQEFWTADQVHAGRQAAIAAATAQATREFDTQRARFQHVRDIALSPEAAVEIDPANRAHVEGLQAGCRTSDLDACIRVAQVFAAGRIVPRDAPVAEAIYWLGCEAGHDASCRSYDRTVDEVMPLPRSGFDPTWPWRQERCATGDPEACLKLAEAIMYGIPVFPSIDNNQDKKELAAQFLERACALGARSRYSCESFAVERLAPPLPSLSAISALDAGCTKGIVVDCLERAETLRPTDPDRAITLSARACRLGGVDTCGMVEYGILNGADRAVHQLLLIEENELRCGDGRAKNCLDLANLYRDGPDATRDQNLARHWLLKGCQILDPEPGLDMRDCRLLVDEAFNALAPEIDAMVLPTLRSFVTEARNDCIANDASACHDLATFAKTYQAAPLLHFAAQGLYARACEFGATDACTKQMTPSETVVARPSAATACASDDVRLCAEAVAADVTQPPQDRLFTLQARCAQGNGAACGRVGGLYTDQFLLEDAADSWSPQKDMYLATDFHRMGCDLNDGPSCGSLADIIAPKRNPTRTEKALEGSPQEVFGLYSQACDLGHPQSCLMAAGLADDPDQTLRFSLRACRLGDRMIGCDGVLSAVLNRDIALRISEQGALAVALTSGLELEKPHSSGTLRRLQRGCAAAVTADCMELALLFNGQSHGVSTMHYGMQYWALANALHRHACDLGQGDGCAELAEQVRWDRASDPLGEKGLNMLGCEQGSERACYQAAGNWDRHSAAPDPAKEIEFTEKACKLSDRLDCQFVADVMRDNAVAEYDQKVIRCLSGEKNQCYLAGRYGVEGSSPPYEVKQALYDYGCRFGHSDACQARASMQ